MGCCSSTEIKRDWKPLEERSCTDLPWLLIFILFCAGMACICGYPIATGAASRLVRGYDSYGNTCGKNNTKIEGVPLSGRDMTENNKSVPLLHRCIPTDIGCYAEFAQAFVTFVSDNSVLRRVVAGVVLLLVMFFMRKRVALTISLFHVAGKVFIHLPLLALQPFWTFLCLMLFWVYWIAVLLTLGTSGTTVKNNSTGLVEYQMQGPYQYLVWYHAVGLIWISEFILAFQQMTISGAVVTYYFTRNKSQMPATPILSSMARTFRYHLGTLAKGSFIITLVKIPRLILMYIHSQLKGKNAYTATAINSTNFCTSARDAFLILVENALRVAAINTVGDFVLFLGKVLVVACTAFAGVLALNYQREYTVWVLPLLIVSVFAFLVAHCFLSVFENVVDVLFLCFAVDSKYNDGSPGREYYMDKALMEYVENSKKSGLYKPGDGHGQELKSMIFVVVIVVILIFVVLIVHPGLVFEDKGIFIIIGEQRVSAAQVHAVCMGRVL
ncbi:hypothetical protein F7725_005434 [Dissostichus mawsoni]|uniref:Choline transporter-like protein n=1 Tax=Dissostichus mawsoni TaxID=36200 RepID=A0A7J5YTQ3_DISMA|nr:hypothetical protein F7725_005434 [Dissostichus mawsoni]